jgi:hypothetical protein
MLIKLSETGPIFPNLKIINIIVGSKNINFKNLKEEIRKIFFQDLVHERRRVVSHIFLIFFVQQSFGSLVPLVRLIMKESMEVK